MSRGRHSESLRCRTVSCWRFATFKVLRPHRNAADSERPPRTKKREKLEVPRTEQLYDTIVNHTGVCVQNRDPKMRFSVDSERIDLARGRSQDRRRSKETFQPHFLRNAQQFGKSAKSVFGKSLLWNYHSDSNVDLFSKLPAESIWVKHGLVERQTSATRVP